MTFKQLLAKLKARSMTRTIARSIAISLALCLFSLAQADMLISPTRVLMDDDNRSATLTLRNPSNGARTYRLRWQDKRAIAGGGYSMITEGEEWPSAKGMVRHSPRQITVGPGENQTVRFSWRPPAELPAGEYRSHLLLEVIPDISEPTSTLESGIPDKGIGIQVHMQMSFSIPVVVRHNTQAPKVSIGDVKVIPAKEGKDARLAITFNRAGNASSYGRVVVEMQRDADNPVELIGEYRELSIFHELDSREITVPLRDKRIPAGAWIRITYDGLKEYQGTLWAEKVFKTQ
jgi:fimbrial chaperone protein